MKLSVIIPVYNVEDYLEQCLRSVVAQSHSDLEIILVNDGSTDGSGLICERFARSDQRIYVIHQKNAGVSVARNTGISVATGEYLTFVDSDDWLEIDMYQTMLEKANSNGNIDVLMCDYKNLADGTETQMGTDLREGFHRKSDIVGELFPTLLVTETLGRIPIVSACICLFHKSLFINHAIKFDENLRYSEDYLFMAEIMLHAESFYYLKDSFLYNYRQYQGSRSKKYQTEWWVTLVSLNDKLKNLLGSFPQYDFTRQIKLQMIHSALFTSSSIYCNQNMAYSEKVTALSKVFSEEGLRDAFTRLNYKGHSMSMRIVLLTIKKRMPGAYLLYLGAISVVKKLREPK